LQRVRSVIRSSLPRGATETISYKIPAFRHGEVLIWFAAFANHCSIFPTARVIEQFKNDLKAFTISKGTVQFPIDKPFPASLLKKMVKSPPSPKSKAKSVAESLALGFAGPAQENVLKSRRGCRFCRPPFVL